MKKLLIGLAGLARTGKTTAAKHLVCTHNLQTYAFADPLREGLTTILNLSPRDFDDEHKEQPVGWLGHSARELMQSLGTEWGRDQIHPDLWVWLAEQNLDRIQQELFAVMRQEKVLAQVIDEKMRVWQASLALQEQKIQDGLASQAWWRNSVDAVLPVKGEEGHSRSRG